MKPGKPLRRKKPLRTKKELRQGKPLRAKKEMARGAGPKRKTRMRVKNEARAEKKFARNFHSSEYVEFTRDSACLFCGRGPSMCGHIRHARGMGGAHGTWEDTGPVCGECDEQWEGKGRKTFLRRKGLTMAEVEIRLAEHHRRWREYLAASRDTGSGDP